MSLRLVPMTITDAKIFVAKHHRHNLPPVSALFAVGVSNGNLCGVGLFGRPVGRELQDGLTGEITRVCTVGDRNANSMLYGALLRAARSLGWRRVYTYTLEGESGSSLRAVGFTVDAVLPPRETWDTPSRHRDQQDIFGEDRRPKGTKIRWVKHLM